MFNYFLFTLFIVLNLLKIMVEFIFENTKQKLIFFFGAEIGFFGPKQCPSPGTELSNLVTSGMYTCREAR